MAITLPATPATKPEGPVCRLSKARHTFPARPLHFAPRSIDELLDEAKARGVFLASLVVASDVHILPDNMREPFTIFARSLFQAAISMRLDDLAERSVSQANLDAYSELATDVFDLIIAGSLERARQTGPLN